MSKFVTHDQYTEVRTLGGSARCQRPNSTRLVNPVAECNRLLDRIEQLEAAIKRVRNISIPERGLKDEYSRGWNACRESYREVIDWILEGIE